MLLSSESKVDGVTPWAKQALNAGGPEAQSKITSSSGCEYFKLFEDHTSRIDHPVHGYSPASRRESG
jgi:hypothetical protein